MNNSFLASVRNGGIILDNPSEFMQHLLKYEGKSVIVTIGVPKSRRSIQANKYLWGVVYKMISEETGNDEESIHEFCKETFNPKNFILTNRSTGEMEERMIGGSTAKMTTPEFWEFIEKIRSFFASEYSIRIPDPNEIIE